MDESSLRTQLNNLEALRSSLHSSFRFWDWVVVAGVALEFIVLIVEYCDEWCAFWRATIRAPEKPKTWLFLIGFGGIAMVAGGIAKELHIDSQIEGVETQIRGVNEQLFGIVSKEAESASSVSSDAKAKAGVAVATASKAFSLVHKTEMQEENIAWRLLTDTEIKQIGNKLRAFVEQPYILEFRESLMYLQGAASVHC